MCRSQKENQNKMTPSNMKRKKQNKPRKKAQVQTE